jgi:hypothetical protein
MSAWAARALWSAGAVRLAASALLMQSLVSDVPARAGPGNTLHYASNGNFSSNGIYLPGAIGFNLADVSKVAQLNSLPDGVKGLVWVGQCKGVDTTFLNTVRPYIGNAKLFGFYLMDDPDPTGVHRPLCTADNLKAESDWIHANVPGAKTFILLMHMSSSKTPLFTGTYNPTNSHVDLFGIDPYPCRTELKDCDYNAIDRYVAAAESWGVPRDSMVPVYQAFGGGNWVDDGGGRYVLPTVSQLQQILARWDALVPTPVFDYAYSWGSQNADVALDRSPDLQAVFRLRNRRLSDRLQREPVGREAC